MHVFLFVFLEINNEKLKITEKEATAKAIEIANSDPRDFDNVKEKLESQKFGKIKGPSCGYDSPRITNLNSICGKWYFTGDSVFRGQKTS